MIIKKFAASTVDEVKEKITTTLGPNAFILTSRQIRHKGLKAWFYSNQVEVVAAIDENDLKAYENFKHTEEVTPHLTYSPDNVAMSSQQEAPLGQSEEFSETAEPLPSFLLSEESLQKMIDDLILRFGKNPFFDHLNPYFNPTNDAKIDKSEISSFLTERDVSPEVIEVISEEISQRLLNISAEAHSDTLHTDAYKHAIASHLPVFGPICLSKDRPTVVAIVGTSGAGKTTVALQIAMQYVLEAGKKAAIISYGLHRLGSKAQIEAMAAEFNLPLTFASEKNELQDALHHDQESDLILIDVMTSTEQREEMHTTLKSIEGIQIHLVSSLSTKDEDAFLNFKFFEELPLSALIFTRWDQAAGKASVLNLCFKTHLPVSYLVKGPNILTDLSIAESNLIANAIL